MPSPEDMRHDLTDWRDRDSRGIPVETFQQARERLAQEAWEADRLKRVEEKLDRLLAHAEGRLQHIPGIGWGVILEKPVDL